MDEPVFISRSGATKTAWVTLSATLNDDLNWEKGIEQACHFVQAGHTIFWEIDLGIDRIHFPLDDDLVFHARCAAIDHFSKTVMPVFQKATMGVCLYRGPLDLSSHFVWSGRQKQGWEESHKKSLRLFCVENYASYFQRLASNLPDDLAVFLLFDVTGIKKCEALELLSKRRFERFELAVRGISTLLWSIDWEGQGSPLGWIGEGMPPKKNPTPTIGVLFPEDVSDGDEDFLSLFDGMNCRMISQSFLMEEWDGLEVIVVRAGQINSRDRRKLMGFCAAGGLVVTFGESLELSNEISGNDWLKTF